MSNPLKQPGFVMLAAAAGGGVSAEVLGALEHLDLTAAQIWPLYAGAAALWIKETVLELLEAWRRPPDKAQLQEAAEAGAKAFVQTLKRETRP